MSLRRQTRPPRGADRRGGMVLVTALILLALLCFFAAALCRTTIPELASATFQRQERQAFYDAEGGVRYVVNCIGRDIANGTLSMTDATDAVSYSAPTGFSFSTVTTLARVPDGGYTFTVTGHSAQAVSILEATVGRQSALATIGMFGDDLLQLQPNIEIYSYDSRLILNPVIADSTGQASVGSNEGFVVRPGAYVDGIFVCGLSDMGTVPTVPSGYNSISVGRVNPDPFGAIGGPLANAFSWFSSAAHNSNATAGIVGNTLSVGNHETATLAGGRYYLTDVSLDSGATLTVTATPDNPVIIYLAGGFRTQPNSTINCSGRPSSFFIFSNSDEQIRMQPNGDFRGFIYAPYADLQLQPGGAVYGVFWAKTATIQPGNDIFVDTSLLSGFYCPQVKMLRWRAL